jgi:uncharacterized protein (DUF1330 family)
MAKPRLDPRAFVRLFRRRLPAPVDVLNFLTVRDFESYRWYALLVGPLLIGAGGSVAWGGEVAQQIHGPAVCGKFLIVRYPSHRLWLMMVANPYYLLINRFRARGVERFEASFSTPESLAPLRGNAELVAVHFNADDGDAALARVKDIVAGAGGRCVYASREVAPISILTSYGPNDPNPLTFKRTALFASADVPALVRALTPDLLASLARATTGLSVQLLRRGTAADFMPSVVRSSPLGRVMRPRPEQRA